MFVFWGKTKRRVGVLDFFFGALTYIYVDENFLHRKKENQHEILEMIYEQYYYIMFKKKYSP